VTLDYFLVVLVVIETGTDLGACLVAGLVNCRGDSYSCYGV
jgi:hypothetical protein